MNVLVNGDSFSAPDKNNSSYSNFLTGNVTNIAERGCSNDRIFRTTFEYCLTNKPDFVIVGWSYIHRQEVTHNHALKTLDWVLDEKHVDDHYKMLVDYEWNYKKLITDFYTQVSILSSWLESNNIKYYFFSAADNSFQTLEHYSNLLELEFVKHVLNNSSIANLHNWSIKHWAETANVNTKPSGHLLFDGQRKFAEYINENII